jgi:hypothetical protein
MGVSDQARNQVNEEINRTAMTGMLNLGNVLELVVDGFDDGALA